MKHFTLLGWRYFLLAILFGACVNAKPVMKCHAQSHIQQAHHSFEIFSVLDEKIQKIQKHIGIVNDNTIDFNKTTNFTYSTNIGFKYRRAIREKKIVLQNNSVSDFLIQISTLSCATSDITTLSLHNHSRNVLLRC